MKRILLIILILLIAVSASGMMLIGGKPVGGKATIGYNTENHGTANATNTIQVSIDPVDGASNKVLIIGIGWEAIATRTIGTVTYDGDACTVIDAQPYEASDLDGVALYYFLAPVDTAKDIVVTMSDTCAGISMGAVVLNNVKQQAYEAKNKAEGNSTTAAVTVTTLTDGAWVVDVVGNISSTATNTPDTGDERWTASDDQTTDMSTILKASFGAEARSWTINSSQQWGIVGSAWEPADL